MVSKIKRVEVKCVYILVSDDVDTDLLRMLASKSLHVNKADKGKKGWSKHSNGAISPAALHPDFR